MEEPITASKNRGTNGAFECQKFERTTTKPVNTNENSTNVLRTNSNKEGYALYVANKFQSLKYGGVKTIGLFEFRELSSKIFWISMLSEFIGSLIFMFLGSASSRPLDGMPQPVFKIAFAFGLSVMAVVAAFKIQINPVVAISFFLTGKQTFIQAFVRSLLQFSSAIVAAFILKGLLPPSFRNNVSLSKKDPQVSPEQAFVFEAIMTFVLMFVIYATMDPDRTRSGYLPVSAGLTVAGLVLSGATYSGTSLNPARSLGSAVASNDYTHIWIYLAGPTVGGIVASLSYTYIFSPYKYVSPYMTVDEATVNMLSDEGPIYIPKKYFED